MFIGGNLNFSSVKDVSSNFGISPVFGYWLNDKSAVVVKVGFNNHHTDLGDVTGSTIGFGAEYRYGWHLGDNLYTYLAPGVGYSIHDPNTDIDDNEDKSLDLGINGGLQYMIAPRWSINSRWGGLTYSSLTVGKADAVGSFSFSFFDNLNLGLNYHF